MGLVLVPPRVRPACAHGSWPVRTRQSSPPSASAYDRRA